MENQKGAWQNYVEEHLLPRLNGFEFMMAPYAVAHLKLDMVLAQTGYKARQDKRLRIFLTNSLEECDHDTGTLFAQWLAQEANEANLVKRDTPVMVMIGNPPYSGISSNNGEWIMSLIEEYKYINGVYFNERKHWLNDDYVKFIRLAEEYVNRNESGILAYINNHKFLDNPTFRCMRYHLMNSFDSIYILNLHGNSTIGERGENGEKDENVFDIQQGVSINIFIKDGSRNQHLANVFYKELYGKRQEKYEFLKTRCFSALDFKQINPNAPYYFFIPKTDEGRDLYERGFKINDLMKTNVMGITTARDFLVIDSNKETLLGRINHFANQTISDEAIRNQYFGNKSSTKYPKGDTRGWKLSSARVAIQQFNHNEKIRDILYRPFDSQYIYYAKEMVDWSRENVMKNFFSPNLGLCLIRVNRDDECTILATNKITDKTVLSSKDNANVFPLYLYPTDGEEKLGETRKPNLDESIWRKIDASLDSSTPFPSASSGNFFVIPDLIGNLLLGRIIYISQ